jgi:molybdenum storage protein
MTTNQNTPRKEDGRIHVASRLAGESLVDKEVIAGAGVDRDVIRMLPRLNVLKIGAQSVIDRGRAAVQPIVEEIISLLGRYQILLGAGGGTRSRHVYDIGLRLGLPTGLLAVLGSAPSEQNATMLQALLAQHGGVRIPKDHFEEIPLYLAADCIPIVTGMPPYHYWERPPLSGHLPEHRTDVGVYLVAEVFGARSMIFVKDEDGLFRADPKKDRSAEFVPEISVSELRQHDLDDLIIERACVEMISRARHCRAVQIINGLVPGRITAALAGEHVGTVIYRDGVDWRRELVKDPPVPA